MNWIDWIIVLVVGGSFLGGFREGAARVIIGLCATVAGIFLGMWCYRMPASHIVDYFASPGVADLVGFGLIFFACIIAGALIASLVARVLKWVGLSWLDRFLGGVFGFVRGVVITVAVITVLVAFAPNPPPRSVTESRLLPYFIDASGALAITTPHQLKDSFRDAEEKVKKIWDEHNKAPQRVRRQKG